MSKAIPLEDQYEKLVANYLDFKKAANKNILAMANTILEVKNSFSGKGFEQFLNDSRIRLSSFQANKFIKIANACKSASRLAKLFEKEGVEKAYLLSKIEDEKTRNQLIDKIIDVPFTVKETKKLVDKVSTDSVDIVAAITEIQSIKKEAQKKKTKAKVSEVDQQKEPEKVAENLEIANLKQEVEDLKEKLTEAEAKIKDLEEQLKSEKTQNYSLQKEIKKTKEETVQLKKQLEEKLAQTTLSIETEKDPGAIKSCTDNIEVRNVSGKENEDKWLKEPVETNLPDGTILEDEKVIVWKGYKLPVTPAHRKNGHFEFETMKVPAIIWAEQQFGLKLPAS